MGYKFIFIVLLILSISFISAKPFPDPTVDVGIGFEQSTDSGVQVFIPDAPVFDNQTLGVNSSEIWETNLGSLDNANSTHFSNEGGFLTIVQSWLKNFGDGLWCALTGCTMTGNITSSEWFNGKFNWVVLNNYTGFPYLNFNGSTLNFDQNILDDRIQNQTASTTFFPTSNFTLYGIEDGGNNIGNISFIDDEIAAWSEVGGVNALEIYINFSGVTLTPDFLVMAHQYAGSHLVQLQLWDYSDSDWETYDTIVPQASVTKDVIAIVDGANHVSGELVQVRFIHPGTGNPSDDFFLDALQLVNGFSSVTTTEHDGLSGRDSQETNHPWAMPRNSSLELNTTANVTVGGVCFNNPCTAKIFYNGSSLIIQGG